MPKTIIDLLKSENYSVVQGIKTRIFMKIGDELFYVRSESKKDFRQYTVEEYTGESEEEAARAFIESESKK